MKLIGITLLVLPPVSVLITSVNIFGIFNTLLALTTAFTLWLLMLCGLCFILKDVENKREHESGQQTGFTP